MGHLKILRQMEKKLKTGKIFIINVKEKKGTLLTKILQKEIHPDEFIIARNQKQIKNILRKEGIKSNKFQIKIQRFPRHKFIRELIKKL